MTSIERLSRAIIADMRVVKVLNNFCHHFLCWIVVSVMDFSSFSYLFVWSFCANNKSTIFNLPTVKYNGCALAQKGQSFNAITEIESKLKRNLEIMPMAKWKIIFAWVVSVSGCSLRRNEINEGKRVQSKRKMHTKNISTANENDREKSSTEEFYSMVTDQQRD